MGNEGISHDNFMMSFDECVARVQAPDATEFDIGALSALTAMAKMARMHSTFRRGSQALSKATDAIATRKAARQKTHNTVVGTDGTLVELFDQRLIRVYFASRMPPEGMQKKLEEAGFRLDRSQGFWQAKSDGYEVVKVALNVIGA